MAIATFRLAQKGIFAPSDTRETEVKSDCRGRQCKVSLELMAKEKPPRARVERSTETVEGWSKEWLHVFNLPANTDIRGMQEQLARMERRLVSLAKEIADLEEDGKRPTARRRAPVKKQPPPPAE